MALLTRADTKETLSIVKATVLKHIHHISIDHRANYNHQDLIPAWDNLSDTHRKSERLLPIKTGVKLLSWNEIVDKVEKWIAVSAEVKVVNLKDLRKLIFNDNDSRFKQSYTNNVAAGRCYALK